MSNLEQVKRQADVLLVDEKDNVGVALRELSPGEEVNVPHRNAIRIRSPIPLFHKFALEQIERGKPIVKYGEEIGRASTTIEAGEHIHLHNLICDRGQGLSTEAQR
jgi:hypothetical protein